MNIDKFLIVKTFEDMGFIVEKYPNDHYILRSPSWMGDNPIKDEIMNEHRELHVSINKMLIILLKHKIITL